MRAARETLLIVFALAAIAASAPQQQAPNQEQPRFRAATTLIQVDAVVRDKDGHFVADLKADDFEVREDGAPQTVETFLLVTHPGGPTAAGAPAPPAVPQTPPAPPPTRAQRLFVLLFDQEHMAPGSFERARSGAEQFLVRDFQPGDIGGIVNGGTMVKNRLTSDREELLADIKAVRPTSDSRSRQLDMREWPRFLSEYELWRVDYGDLHVTQQVVARACADDPTLCLNADTAVQQKARRLIDDLRATGQRTMQTVRGLATGLAKLPGRKTIVFLSDGFFAEDSWGNLRDVIGSAARASVSVYAIDTRGLNRGTASSDIFETGPHAPVDPGGTLPSFDIGADAPNSLAVDTGGLAIRNENDFAKAFREIVDDTSNYYILGYRPANANFDGKFRQIAVRVKRPGVSVRARRGYLATAEPAPASVPEPAPPAPATPAAVPAGAPASGAPKAEAPPTETPMLPPATPPRKVPEVTSEGAAGAVRMRPHVGEEVAELEKRASAAEPAAEKAALPDALVRQARDGWDAYQHGDVQKAKAFLSPVAVSPAAPPWVLYVLGWSEFALAEYAASSTAWERVHQAVPEFEPVYFDLADSYLQQKEFGRALVILRDAERRWPNDVEVFNAIGVAQIGRGALDDAIQTFEKAVAINPADATACYNLARVSELRFIQAQRLGHATRTALLPTDLENRDRAIEYYRRTVQLGGPLADSAREGLKRFGVQ